MNVYKILFLLGFTLFISGCSLNEGTENLYRQENVLNIELVIPTDMEVNNEYELQAILTEQVDKVPEIENITFTIWKNGNDNRKDILPENDGNGTYKIHTIFEEEGLYFIKVEASTKDSSVMPTKQFTVGTLSEEDLNSLHEQIEEEHHEGHH